MVDVIGRAKVIVESAIDKSSLDTTSGTIGASLKKGAVIGVAALGTLAVGAVKTFQAFEEAEAQSRKLNQVLDNMGKSSAAPAVEKLATELSNLTAVDDDLIKQGQTLLATFSNVAESAGTTGGVFERATIAALDLSATGFGSVESASVALGKALQDPEKGITALGRAGVTFTEEQKKLIEGFIAVNDVASAQKIILEEVEKQVGGTAESVVTESDKITKELGDMQENLGALVANLVTDSEDVGTFSGALHNLNEELAALDESEGWAGIRASIRGIGKAILFVVDLLGEWSAFWEEAGGDFRDFQTELDEGYAAIIGGWKEVIGTFKEGLNSIPFLGRFIDAPSESGSGGGSFAVGGPASGLALVGERGPELVSLPAGSYVHNNNDTKQMLSGGGDTVVINNQYFGPVTGNEQKREIEWSLNYGLRFGTQTGFSPSVVNS